MEVSLSIYNESIAGELERLDTDEAQNSNDPRWWQFLRDHREIIIAQSSWLELTEETMMRYRYRIRDFIVNVLKLPVANEVAFRVINRLGSNSDFNSTLDGCWVPTNAQILDLFHRFNTCASREADQDAEIY